MSLGTRVKVDGIDKIDIEMQDLLKDILDDAGKILTEGAEILKDEAVKLAPGPTGQKYGKYPHPPGTLKKSITVGEPRKRKGAVTQAVGVAKNQYFSQDDLFYARFQELGTSKMQASPFMRPAAIKSRGRIREHVTSRLKQKL